MKKKERKKVSALKSLQKWGNILTKNFSLLELISTTQMNVILQWGHTLTCNPDQEFLV